MISCWEKDPKNRPKFSSLVKIFSGILEKEAKYLQLGESLKLMVRIQMEGSVENIAESGREHEASECGQSEAVV